MHTVRRWVLVVGLCSASCRSSSTPTATAAPEQAKPSPAPTGPAVVVRNGERSGAVEIEARRAIELDSRLFVERLSNGGVWEPVENLDGGSMKLVESCGHKVLACVSLPANHTLRPVPWSGMSCSSQCNVDCDKNVERAGRHRYVVRTCDGTERFEGPPFDLPKK